ncbi:MAG TPA: MraY family glycosyltransferase [bacterium]|nr:MraY family glycosyltransferase [bacterium]HPR88677.1 MraY family glycosyltransferase [bacterium]
MRTGTIIEVVLRYLTFIAAFSGALTLALIFVRLAMVLAVQWDIQDHPAGRKDHARVTPLLGGLGIYAAFVTALAAGLGLLWWSGHSAYAAAQFPLLVRQVPRLAAVWPKLALILTGATLLVAVGLIDDIRGITFPPAIKFAVQIAAAVIAVAGGARSTFLPWPWLDALFSVLWIVAISNVFNFLDNMDGLSAGIALICGALFFWLTAQQGQYFSALLFALLCGACLGFLRYNLHPARVFMGDAGSLFIGYLFGTLSLTSSYVVAGSASLIPILIPLLVLGVPIFDAVTVILIRIREHRPVYVGDQCHISHRLLRLGLSRNQVVVFVHLISIAIGMSALLLPYISLQLSILVLLQTILVYVILTLLIRAGRKH